MNYMLLPVPCLFGRGRFLDVSLVCIGHLRLCARQLAEGGVDVTLQVRPRNRLLGVDFPTSLYPSPVMHLGS